MYTFLFHKKLLNATVVGKNLLGELSGKRKSFDYCYQQAIELMEKEKLVP